MKKWEKEILANKISKEEDVIKRLEKTYSFALNDVQQKVAVLQSKPQTQSVIYQLKYQKALKKQLEEVYNKMASSWYDTVDEYLQDCYEDSFYSTMYGLHQQGIPLIFPFPQDEVAEMTSVAADGIKLSKKLYQNTTNLARISREEISRGIATGESYSNIALALERRGQITVNQAYRIVRTEGHRINQEVQFKTLHKAQDKGADIVKQWDSTLDKRTRHSHAELDGQLRELDQPFKIPSNGHTAQYPGGFGVASEDINCRCVVLQRARWALDKSEIDKMVGDLSGMSDEDIQKMADKLGVDKNDLINSQNNLIKAKNYNEFKKKYQTKAKQAAAKQAAQAQVQAQAQNGSPFTPDAYGQRKKDAWANRFRTKEEADKYYRPELDKQWLSLSDKEKYSEWEYTRNSNPMNKPLSGYANGYWDRSSFVGVGNADWGTEDSWRSIPSAFSKFGNNGHATYREVIKNLTTAIDKTVIDRDVFLVRGSDSNGLAGLLESSLISFDDAKNLINGGRIDDLKKIVLGNKFQNHSFMSTGIANGAGFSGSVKYKIYCPKGTKGIYAEPQSYFGATVGSNARLYKAGESYYYVGHEAEIILQRGTTFRVTKISGASNNLTVEMEVVEQPNYFKTGYEETFNNGATLHKK